MAMGFNSAFKGLNIKSTNKKNYKTRQMHRQIEEAGLTTEKEK